MEAAGQTIHFLTIFREAPAAPRSKNAVRFVIQAGRLRSAACACATQLGRLGKAFIPFFLVGEQLLNARALLHTLEMSRNVGEA